MRSPSGGEARRRGGTQVGKAPPSPEMTVSGLTRGQVFGEDQIAKDDLSRLCRTCGPPLRRAVSFLGSTSPVSRKSLCAIAHSDGRLVSGQQSQAHLQGVNALET